jgi:glycosyltransferase involved in cell wall biosynthesis
MPTILFGISSSFCAHFMKGQVAYLVSKGFRVVVVSGDGEEITTLCKEEGAELILLPFSRSITPLHDLALLVKLMGIIRKVKPDIINAGNPKPGLLMTLAAWILRKQGRIFTLHGLVSDSREGFKGWMISWFEKLSCSLAQKVLVVSPSLADHAIRRGILNPSKAVVIGKGSYNGIDLNRFQKTPAVMTQANAFRAKQNIMDAHFVFGFVGRITVDKGIDLLMTAFTKLFNENANVRLIMAGPMDQENAIPSSLLNTLNHHPGVRLLGNVSDIVPVYPLMQVLVLSSYREGFGNVLLEAAAMDVPVIAPAIPGCSDAMRPGLNGLSFPKADAAALYQAMKTYVDNPSFRSQHASAGRAFAAGFDPVSIWDGQLSIYRGFMDK